MRRHIALVGAVLVGAHALGAQGQSERVALGGHAGLQRFGRGTALENAPFMGFDALGPLPWNPLARVISGSSLGVRALLDVAHPVTRGNQFGAVAVDRGDTTFLYTVAQRVTLLQGGAEVVVGAPMGPLRAYGFVGAGAYSVLLSPRVAKASGGFTHAMATFGGGLKYPASERLIVMAQLRAVTLMEFERQRLDAGSAYAHDSRFRDALPPPDAPSRNPTNVQLSLALQYIARTH